MLPSHSQGGGVRRELEDRSSTFTSSKFGLCDWAEVTSPLSQLPSLGGCVNQMRMEMESWKADIEMPLYISNVC